MDFLPEQLCFHLPTDPEFTVEISGDAGMQYTKLVTWCLIQNYWYYCLGMPHCEDSDYDFIRDYLQELETEFAADIPVLYNGHGVTLSPTTGQWKQRQMSHYPVWIQKLFEGFYGQAEMKLIADIQQTSQLGVRSATFSGGKFHHRPATEFEALQQKPPPKFNFKSRK